jgi:hypothetical protein
MISNRLKAYFEKEQEPAATPTFPKPDLTIMGLYALIHEMEQDRRELQQALDDQIAEVARLNQLLSGQ